MKEIIKTVIKNFHKSEIPGFKERSLPAPLNSGMIISLTGSRRTGKAYYLYQLISKLLETVKKENVLYINFEDARLNSKSDDLRLINDAYYIVSKNIWRKMARIILGQISRNVRKEGATLAKEKFVACFAVRGELSEKKR